MPAAFITLSGQVKDRIRNSSEDSLMSATHTVRTIAEVLDKLANTPGEIEKLLHGLSVEQLTTRLSPEEFSAAEHVCHLRDIDTEGYSVRIQRMLAELNPQLEDVEGARLAAERDYNSEDIVTAWRSFAEIRKQIVATLRGLDQVELNRTGVLVGVGQITVSELVSMMQEHDASHLEEMSVVRERLLTTHHS